MTTRRIHGPMVPLALGLLLALSACGGGGTEPGGVSLAVSAQWPPEAQQVAQQVSTPLSAPLIVATIRVTVNVDGWSNVQEFPVAAGTATIAGVPVGAGTLTLEALDGSDSVRFTGSSPFSGLAGETVEVTVVMHWNPPGAPGTLTASTEANTGTSTVSLSWGAPTDGDPPTAYNVFRSETTPVDTTGTPLATTPDTSYADATGHHWLSYHYVVVPTNNGADGPASNEVSATPPSLLVHPSQVGAGADFSCALDDNGVTCWGNSDGNRLNVPALTNATHLAVNNDHACAIDDDGVHCWGGSSVSSVPPGLTGPFADVTAVFAGDSFACALQSGAAVCWGIGYSDYISPVPTFTDATQGAGGFDFACVISTSAGLQCWGNDLQYTFFSAPSSPTWVSATFNGVCVVDAGTDNCSDLAPGNPPFSATVIRIAAGLANVCTVDGTGVHCVGNPSDGLTNVPALSNPTWVAAGWFHICAVDDAGVHCWGKNDKGQINVP
jgi:hypothetical protein